MKQLFLAAALGLLAVGGVGEQAGDLLRTAGHVVERLVGHGHERHRLVHRHRGLGERRRVVAGLLARNGVGAITAALSPYASMRREIRGTVDNFVEVFVEAPLEVVEERDTKGLYKKARSGEIKNFTGVSDPYEDPENAEVTVHTGNESIEESAKKILDYLVGAGLVNAEATV